MNIEQLKMIIDLLQKAGEAGSDLFIIYVLAETVPSMLGAGFMIGLLYMVVIFGYRLIYTQTLSGRIAHALGLSTWEINERKTEAIISILKENSSQIYS